MDPALPAGLKVGAVSYLNTKPLIYGLETETLILDVPSVLAAEFLRGNLDVALLPFFAVLQAGGSRLVDDVAIACRGEVYSVFVAGRGSFAECGDIYLDPSSRSSSALLKVLLAEFYPGTHRVITGEDAPPDAARLLIGDPAIAFRHMEGNRWVYHDLGALWKKHTGLPFVFAVWAVGDRGAGTVGDLLRARKQAGLAAREEIAAGQPDPEFARNYLTDYVRFGIGPEEKQAMLLFEALARRHGVLPPGPSARITWC